MKKKPQRDPKSELLSMAAAISLAAQVLRPHLPLMREYARERDRFEGIGPVLAPSLYMDSERRVTDTVMWPLIQVATRFVIDHDVHVEVAKAALLKVRA